MRLLVLDNSPVLFGDTEKKLEKPLPPPPPRKLRPFGPPGGVWIFSGTTQFNPLYTDTLLIRTLSMVHSVSILTRFGRTVHKFCLKNKSITIPLKHHCWNPRQVEYRHLQRKHLHPLLVIHQYIEPEI